MNIQRKLTLTLGAVALSLGVVTQAQAETIVMASTTSTEQSGLFKHLLPKFKAATGVDVKVVAQGTGQALETGRRGDADILFVHDPAKEKAFVEQGYGVKRFTVMYNDFVLIGPGSDPAKVKGNNVSTAFATLAKANGPFISRGDKSGTHSAELRFWKLTGSDNKGSAYKACGCGMGPALNMASAENAYVLSDRGTWLSFKNKGQLQVLVEGDQRMFNQYGVMVVNPAKHPHVKVAAAQKFIDWVVSAEGQSAIAAYQVNGQQLFFPNAGKGN